MNIERLLALAPLHVGFWPFTTYNSDGYFGRAVLMVRPAGHTYLERKILY